MPEDSDKLYLQLPHEAYDNLKLIITHSSYLTDITNSIAEIQYASDPNIFASKVAHKTKLDEDILRIIITSLLRFHTICREINITHEEFVTQLGNGFLKYAESNKIKDALSMWESAKDKIIKVLSPDSPFYILEKSIMLAFAHQNIMNDVRLITDIRPVFNDEATKIVKMVVTHLLMLKYYDGESQKQLHLTMDAEDIRKLHELCERAQQKSTVVLDSLVNQDWAISIIGKEEDEK